MSYQDRNVTQSLGCFGFLILGSLSLSCLIGYMLGTI